MLRVNGCRVIGVIALGFLDVILPCGRAVAGPPFVTDDPEPVDYQHWEVYGFTSGTHASAGTSGVGPALEVNYGVAPDLQLHVVLPFAYDEQSGSHRIGYGDTQFGVKYRFIDEDEHGYQPQAGVFPMLVVPTGNPSRSLGTGHTEMFLPLWIQERFGDWTTYGGGGYWYNTDPGVRDYWFTGWLLQRKMTEQLTLGGEIFYQSAGGPGGALATSPAMTRACSGINLGGSYDFTEHDHLLFSVGRGVQNVDAVNRFSFYLGYQWTS